MNKRDLRAALFIAGTALAVPVPVGAVEQQINVGATAAPYCSFDGSASFSGLGNIGVDSTATPTSIVHMVDPVDSSGFMQDAYFTFQIQSTCNAPSEFRLRTLNGGMTNPAPAPVSGSWLQRIDYSAHLTLPGSGGETSSLSTDGTAGALSDLRTNAVAFSGNLQVSFDVTQNTDAPLVGGNYSDTLTIIVNPQ